jgi:alkylresorcinol/alkylpyrone synthase
LDQKDVRTSARYLFSGRADIDRLLPIFENTGIARRYSCVPIDWYTEPHGWRDRTELYIDNSVALLEKVARECLAAARLKVDDIDAIVTVSTTGIATPSLDALLIERMGFKRTVQRLPIFGLGCAGGVIGLARAANLAKAAPESRVLFLVVELCGLTFRKDDLSKSNIVAAALFGDGAAGAIISTRGEGPSLGAHGEHTWPSSLDIMGWEVQEDGLKAAFSQSIPSLVAREFRAATLNFLRTNDISLSSIDAFACHPGGAKVLDALEDAFELSRGDLAESRSVLRDYGNMSAVTVLFVLERMQEKPLPARTLMTSLGPGFTAAFQVVENS